MHVYVTTKQNKFEKLPIFIWKGRISIPNSKISKKIKWKNIFHLIFFEISIMGPRIRPYTESMKPIIHLIFFEILNVEVWFRYFWVIIICCLSKNLAKWPNSYVQLQNLKKNQMKNSFHTFCTELIWANLVMIYP